MRTPTLFNHMRMASRRKAVSRPCESWRLANHKLDRVFGITAIITAETWDCKQCVHVKVRDSRSHELREPPSLPVTPACARQNSFGGCLGTPVDFRSKSLCNEGYQDH
jgi:hypothetical protein